MLLPSVCGLCPMWTPSFPLPFICLIFLTFLFSPHIQEPALCLHLCLPPGFCHYSNKNLAEKQEMLGSISRGRESPEEKREGALLKARDSILCVMIADVCQAPFSPHSSPSSSSCIEDHFLQCLLGWNKMSEMRVRIPGHLVLLLAAY